MALLFADEVLRLQDMNLRATHNKNRNREATTIKINQTNRIPSEMSLLSYFLHLPPNSHPVCFILEIMSAQL